MRIPDQRHVSQIVERFPAPQVIHLTSSVVASQDLGNFDVNQVGGEEHLTLSEKTLACSLSQGGLEEDLQKSGGINDNHRLSRSFLTA